MSDTLEKCTVCRALLDEEDLFCGNCGTEAPHQPGSNATGTLTSRCNFDCSGCGASMSYDASAGTLRCPFCGSDGLQARDDVKVLAPRAVVPFQVGKDQAENLLRQWLGSSFWRPGDLASAASVTKITAVFVPYWVFAARTFTYWTADTSDRPFGSRGDWRPITGEHRGEYAGLLVGASGALSERETWELCPFELAAGVPPEQVDLDNVVVEQFRVQRKYARPQARQYLESREREACGKLVPGRSRHVKVNVRLEGLASEPCLLPVWIMAYRYRDQVYRFLVNGQTGRSTGAAPISWAKVLLVLGVVLGVLLLFFLCVLAAGAMR